MYRLPVLRRRVTRALALGAISAGYVFLDACGGGNGGSGGSPSAPPPMVNPPPPAPMSTLTGTVNGAKKALYGAAVTAYSVGSHGYGSQATVLGTATSDATGVWTISFPKPTDDPLVYVVADGGDLGNGSNAVIGLLTGLGRLSAVTGNVVINEVTTIASVYSMAQFIDADKATNIGSAATNVVGLPNAFANVRNLVDIGTGVALTSADAFTPIKNPVTHASEAPPGAVVNTLAEMLAACVGSNGSSSMACTQLFGLTAAAGGHAPTDTRKAALMIALHPGSQVSALYQLARTSAGLFMPDLGNVMPNDWTIAINFTGAALERSSTAALAIDAEGDVWVSSAQCDPTVTNPRGCVIELSPQGSQSGPFPTLGEAVTPDLAINGGGALAIGTNPNTGQELVWLASIAPSALYAMDARGGQFLFHGALTLGGTLRDPESLQVDLLGNVWAANSNPRFLIDGSSMGSVIEASPGTANDYTQFTEFDVVSPVGAPPPSFTDLVLDGDEPASIFVSDAFGGRIVQFDGGHPGVQVNPPVFASPDQNAPGPVAIDASGNVWAANTPSSHNPAGALELLKGVGVPGYVERDVGGNTILSPGEPGGIAEDGAGNTWVTNTDAAGNKGIVELDPSGASLTALTGLGAYNGASPPSGGPLGFPNVAASPRGLAIDSSGNVWVATGDGGGVVELVGAATPVRTPLNTRAMLP